MRKTLADFMRTDALKMEGAQEPAVTEIITPVTLPAGVTERSRDHLILLPSPGVASSVEVGILTAEDQFIEVSPEQVSVTTIEGGDEVASAVAVKDRALEGQLRIRYVPVQMAMEDADKPFVQLGTVTAPGAENKNPFPANAPTEEAAPQVTNQTTIETDKGALEDKAKLAENAVDQSVAPKIEVTATVAPKEDNIQDDGKVVDANEGNTGVRKAEAAGKETERKGPKEEDEAADNAVNSNGEDPNAAAADVAADQAADDAAAGADNAEDNTTSTDAADDADNVVDENNEDEDEDTEEKREGLKTESFQVLEDINAAVAYVAEADDDEKKSLFTRAIETLKKFVANVMKWLDDKIFSKVGKKKREDATQKAEELKKKLAEEKLAEEIDTENKELVNRYTVGISKLNDYKPLMEKLAQLSVAGLDDATKLMMDFLGLMTKGDADLGPIKSRFEAWFKKYEIKTIFGPSTLEEAADSSDIDQFRIEIHKTFVSEKASGLDVSKLRATAQVIYDVQKAYTKTLDGYKRTNSQMLNGLSKNAVDLPTSASNRDDVALIAKYARTSYMLCMQGLQRAQDIEGAMKDFTMVAFDVARRAERAVSGLKTEGFSQPIEVFTAPEDVTPVVFPAEKPFVPESLVVTRETEDGGLVILRNDKVRVRTNGDGMGDAVIVVDPSVQGQIQANYEAVIEGQLPAMEDGDPVVTLDQVTTDTRDGQEIRIAQILEADSEEPLPEKLVELKLEAADFENTHANVIKGLASAAYMVDMARGIQFEGDEQATELVMEGMLDSIKGAMNRLGNWFDKTMNYYKEWELDWGKRLAKTTKDLKAARGKTPKADVVDIKRIARRLTINGEPVLDLRQLQTQLSALAKLGDDSKAHMVSIGNLYEDVRKLIAKHDNVNPDGAAVLKEIPGLVKKVNLRPWDSLIKGPRQVVESTSDTFPSSNPFLGDMVISKMKSINDLTFANPDEQLRKLLEWTYVGYSLEWELDKNLKSAEMPVLSLNDLEALLNQLRKTAAAWDMVSVTRDCGKKMDAFYRSLWSLREYDRDFLSAYGVIIAADQWAYHPALDLRFGMTYPLQGVMRLIEAHIACYK